MVTQDPKHSRGRTTPRSIPIVYTPPGPPSEPHSGVAPPGITPAVPPPSAARRLTQILRDGAWTFVERVVSELATRAAAWVVLSLVLHGALWLPALTHLITGAVIYLLSR